MSCIDHIYTNVKFRCSDAKVIPFGASDHNLIGYTRYSKLPPQPSCTVRKRSYKNFDNDRYLKDLRSVNWSEVYSCLDVNHAAEVLVCKSNQVLDVHAPWVVYQKRKNYAPWLTSTTLKIMAERDAAKANAAHLAAQGIDASDEWKQFKSLRNKVNNRRV